MSVVHMAERRLNILATVVLLAAVSYGQKYPKGIEVKFFDKFNSEAHLPYDGGRVEIKCKLSEPCSQGDTIQLRFPTNANNQSEDCVGDSAKFEVPINTATIFGEYQRFYGSMSFPTTLNFRYRDRSECINSNHRPNEFCVVTKAEGAKTYATIASEFCDDQHKDEVSIREDSNAAKFQFCSSNQQRLCGAIASDVLPKTWVAQRGGVCGVSEGVSARISYNQATLNYNAHIQLQANKQQLTINCPDGSPAYKCNATCITKGSNGVVDQSSRVCSIGFDLNSPDSIFKNGSRVYKIDCTFTNVANDTMMARLSNYLVFLDGNATIHETKDGNCTKSLECQINPPPSDNITVEYSWTGPNTQGEKGRTLKISQSGDYSCGVELIYEMRDPYGNFSRDAIKSNFTKDQNRRLQQRQRFSVRSELMRMETP